MKTSRLTFRKIAARAGVSMASVSRVARGQLNVDSGVRERVRKAALELGLDLDQRRNERSTIIAFILANRDVLHKFQSRVLIGAEAYCASQSKDLLFMSFQYAPSVSPPELHLPRVLNQRSLVQAVILGGTNSVNMLAALRAREIPFAVLGNNVIGALPDECDAVFSDDVQGGFDLTSHLIGEGHRDIWFVGDTDLPWYSRCAEGYKQSMLNSGLQARFSEIHSDGRELGYLATRSILSRREPITAVFAGSDPIAQGVYEALQHAGLRVPDDISVAGFNDTEALVMSPPLTSVAEYPEELGKHLAEFALRRAQEPDRPPQRLTIPTRLVVRQSTRPVPPRSPEQAEATVAAPVYSTV